MPIAQNLRVNHQIRISPVRLINEKNEQMGIIPTNEALRTAQELDLDLVEVAPQDRPPVCRIMDYGKWKYQQKKRHKGRGSHETQLKEVRLRPKTDTHDRQVKVDRARQFLEKAHKVQFTMLFRGRERFHQSRGLQALLDIASELSDVAKVERPPRMEGRRLTMLLVTLRAVAAPQRAPVQHRPATQQTNGS